MNNLINKINFYHSIIFFLLSTSLAIIIYKFESLIISPLICLLLILSIGISHGALDNQKGKRLIQLYNIKNSYYFYSIYSMIGLSIIIFWLYFPATSLIIFLIVASYHFGKEDMNFLIKSKNASNLILFF
jgi:Brp/Blh family beta-carotene 15,15'-monooxygenase